MSAILTRTLTWANGGEFMIRCRTAEYPAVSGFSIGGPHRIRTYNLLIKSLNPDRPPRSTHVQKPHEIGDIVTAPSTTVHRRLAALGWFWGILG